ncbi:MAG: DUF2452 domain-containing protein [Pseudomonadota bacterium]
MDSDKTKDSRFPTSARASSVTAVTERNPDGKGVVGFLRDWDYSTPRGVTAKPSGQILADYFTSLLVLSASFSFKPVFNKDYYLYFDDGRWVLSLIAPTEWRSVEKERAFAGTCRLHDDSTWSIEPAENLRGESLVADAMAQFFDGFVEKMQSRDPLEDGLPICEWRLPYYQRLFAAALSRSLKFSMRLGDQTQIPGKTWLAELPTSAKRLLTRTSSVD